MTGPRFTRRAAAVLVAGGGVALAGQGSFAAGGGDARLRTYARALGGSEGAARIGAAYLARFPAERDAGRLIDALSAEGVVPSGFGPGRRKALLAMLDRAARQDFAAGRTLRLQGWVLSVTELRAYALAALADGVA